MTFIDSSLELGKIEQSFLSTKLDLHTVKILSSPPNAKNKSFVDANL